MTERSNKAWVVGVVLFEGFELLDVFGPLEIFGVVPESFQVRLVGPLSGAVRSAQGPAAVAESAYEEAPACDIVLVPGGMGTRRLVADQAFLRWLRQWAESAEYVTSVCTGSAVLAAAGLLEGYRATSNKRSFAWAAGHGGGKVEWIEAARWVEDRDRWTSSGVAAGMDMALGLVAHLSGTDVAERVADAIELDWHRDADWDPFAAKHGLGPDASRTR